MNKIKSFIRDNKGDLQDVLIASWLALFLFFLGIYLPIFFFFPVWVFIFVLLKNHHSILKIIFISLVTLIIVKYSMGNWGALVFLFLEINVAVIVFLGIKRSFKSENIVIGFASYIFIVAFLFLGAFRYFKGVAFQEFFNGYVSTYFETNIFPYLADEQRDIWRQGVEFFKSYFYSFFIIWIMVSFFVSYKAAEIYYSKLKVKIKRFFINAVWRPNDYFVFVFLLAFLLYLLELTFFGKNTFLIFICGKNLFFLSFFVYVISGLMLVLYFFKLFAIPRIINIMLCILIIIQPIFLMPLGILGLTDVWFDFRKKKIKKD